MLHEYFIRVSRVVCVCVGSSVIARPLRGLKYLMTPGEREEREPERRERERGRERGEW